MTLFHILDTYTQDVEEGQETDACRQIIPRGGAITDDEEDGPASAHRHKPTALAKARKEEPAVDNTKLRMNIYLFGATPEGKPVRACIEGFCPFFFVRLPNKKAKTRIDFEQLFDETLRAKKRWLSKVVTRSYEDRKVLYGYTGEQTFRFVRLSVPSIAAFRALKRIFLSSDTSEPIFQLYAGEKPLEVFEANLDPMLRFFHLRNIKPAGWVQTVMEPDDDGQIVTDWEEIEPCENPPMASAPFLLAAWDIECYSENGEFPLAKKGFERLAKQVYANCCSGDEAAKLIMEGAEAGAAGTVAPRGVDALRHRDNKLNAAKLQQALSSEVFKLTIGPLLAKKDQATPAQKEERIGKIRTLLGGTLRSVLPLAGDPVIQIGVVLVRAGQPTQKHIFVLGTCEDVPGAIVHSYPTEKEMIIGWAKAMRQWNPDILVGYNVFGFDEKYLWERVVELRIQEDEAFQSLSRLGDMNKQLALEEKFLSSSALGDNTLYMWSTFGRLQVDLYHYIKRSFSLPAYKLDYVCQHFMSGKLGGCVASESTWFLKTKSTADAVVGRYVVLLDETGDVVVDKLRICEIEAGKGLHVEAPDTDDAEDLKAAVGDAVKWAIVKDDVSPADIFNLHSTGGASGRAKVAAYCVQDCDLVVELYKKLDVFNNAMAMANACSVPVSYIFTRGQGIKIESLIFKECYQRKQCVLVLPSQPRGQAAATAVNEDGEPVAQAQEESYEGAIVLTPTPGFYFKSPIGVADFASLYPSTIISENISHDTLVWAKDYDLDGNFVGYAYGSEETVVPDAVAWTDIDFDIWGVKEGDTRKNPEKVKRGLRVCRYAQFAGDAKGTLPDIVQKLLAARKAKRKEAEKETDPFKKALLDAEQLAYKLTANSLYGQLGSGTFKIRLQHLAASVTAYGRKQIMFAKAAIEKFYGPEAKRKDCSAMTVYGDTDSLFITFNVMNPATGELLQGREAIVETMRLTEEAGKLVTTCLKPPHDFEYDKVFAPFIIFSKKRYVGNKYEESPDEYYQNSMGIATKRRDYAGIVKVIYGGAIRILLTEKDPVAAAKFVKAKLMELAEGKVSMTQLTMTKSLRAEYKSATPPAHKVLAERIAARDPGNAPASGDRISFLYVLAPPGQLAAKNQGDRIETPTWIREHGLEVDARFYMEHQLMNPISQLFALIVEELPGCVAPGGRSWTTASASDREYAATEYLFRDALQACDRAAKRRFGQKMFGLSISANRGSSGSLASMETSTPKAGNNGASKKEVKTSSPPPVTPQIQQKLSNFFVQKIIMKELEKTIKKPTTAAAAAAVSTEETTPRRSGRIKGKTVDI
jgi:DNA polymerase elongation subunit (family B)